MTAFKIRVILSCLAFALPLSALHAEHNNAVQNSAYNALTKVTAPKDVNYEPNPCRVTATARFAEYEEHLPEFREAWLDRDYSIDFYHQRQKSFFAYFIVKRIAELITEGIYRNDPKHDCAFAINVSYSDTLGQERTMPIATWRFTEDRDKQVNWDHIDPKDFVEIALNYQITAEAVAWTSDEPSLTDNQNSSSKDNCQENFIRANAIFIRASTYCRKDYMDTPAGFYALAESRHCFVLRPEAKMTSLARSAMLELDCVVKTTGRAAACRWVDNIERDIAANIDK